MAHCIVELLADSTDLPISLYFRAFFFILVGFNFLQSYISAGNELTSKIKYGFSGYGLYTLHIACRNILGEDMVPELVSDVALCQYYLMTLMTFMIQIYFAEIFSDKGAAKVAYCRQKVVIADDSEGKAFAHVFQATDAERVDKYKKLDTLFIKEFESFMTYQMRLNYLHLLDDKLVQSEVQDWSTHKTETVIIITT